MPQLCLNIYSNFFELEPRPDGDTYQLSQISEWDRPDQETADELLQLLARGDVTVVTETGECDVMVVKW